MVIHNWSDSLEWAIVLLSDCRCKCTATDKYIISCKFICRCRYFVIAWQIFMNSDKKKNPLKSFDTGTKRDLTQLNWFHSISMVLRFLNSELFIRFSFFVLNIKQRRRSVKPTRSSNKINKSSVNIQNIHMM